MSKSLIVWTILLTLVALGQAYKEAHADTWVDINGLSKHTTDGYYSSDGFEEWNEVNEGLGVSIGIDDTTEFTTGWYENSYHDTTIYIGVDKHHNFNPYVRAGVTVGMVSGYEDAGVMVLPNIVVGCDTFRVKAGLIPGIEVQVLTLSIGLSF